MSRGTAWVDQLYDALKLAKTDWQVKARKYQLDNPGRSLRQPKVFSIGVTDGPPVSSTNPGSRPEHGDSDADTLAANAIRESGREPDSNGRIPNEAMQDAHAELYVLQELYRQGPTEGRSLKMVVSGRKVCPMCRQDLPQAANAAGLNEWTIFEEESGDTLYWKHGDTHFHLISGE